ncbi:unnamed protein product [Laminaria digitata]
MVVVAAAPGEALSDALRGSGPSEATGFTPWWRVPVKPPSRTSRRGAQDRDGEAFLSIARGVVQLICVHCLLQYLKLSPETFGRTVWISGFRISIGNQASPSSNVARIFWLPCKFGPRFAS